MKKGSLYGIFFMILITAFFTLILAIANDKTQDVIIANQEVKKQLKVLYAFDIPVPEGLSILDIQNLYNTKIEEESFEEFELYRAYDNEDLMGYAFTMEGPGLWGTIKGVVALDKSLNEVMGIDFFSHSETPGLGARIDDDWYKKQFRNIVLLENSPFIAYRPGKDGTVDSISGATITSKAVLNIINSDIDRFKKASKGGAFDDQN